MTTCGSGTPGHSTAVALEVAAAIAPFIAIGVVLCIVVGRSLNVTALGDDLAKSMGGNVARTQALSLVAVTLLAGAATAGAGPDRVCRPDGAARGAPVHRTGLAVDPGLRVRASAPPCCWPPTSSGRVVIRPAELPAGIVTAFLGAPVLIWLIRKRGADRS